MGKVSRVRRMRSKASAAAAPYGSSKSSRGKMSGKTTTSGTATSDASVEEDKVLNKAGATTKHHLSRGQRKRRKGKERIRKRAKFEREMLDQIAKERNTALYGKMSAMKGLLTSLPPNASKAKTSQPKHLTHKQRHRSRASEIAAMSSVLMHPAFKSNPLSAIKQHLESTVAAPQGDEEGV